MRVESRGGTIHGRVPFMGDYYLRDISIYGR